MSSEPVILCEWKCPHVGDTISKDKDERRIIEAIFIEPAPFERYRASYFTDDEFKEFQQFLLLNPRAGQVITHTGGLRKVRFTDAKRHKGKRGGVRIIYYWWEQYAWFLLFTLYDKDQQDDLSPRQRDILRMMLERLKKGETL